MQTSACFGNSVHQAITKKYSKLCLCGLTMTRSLPSRTAKGGDNLRKRRRVGLGGTGVAGVTSAPNEAASATSQGVGQCFVQPRPRPYRSWELVSPRTARALLRLPANELRCPSLKIVLTEDGGGRGEGRGRKRKRGREAERDRQKDG